MGWDDWGDFLAKAIGMKCNEDGDYGLSLAGEKQIIRAALR